MPLTTDEQASANRLATVYNENPYNAQTNPGGFGRGGNSAIGLFIASIKDFAAYGKGVVRVATETLASISAKAAQYDAAVAAIVAGPVTSVNGKTGAVTIDLSQLSADVNAQLDVVKANQTALSKDVAASRAYALAFGG